MGYGIAVYIHYCVSKVPGGIQNDEILENTDTNTNTKNSFSMRIVQINHWRSYFQNHLSRLTCIFKIICFLNIDLSCINKKLALQEKCTRNLYFCPKWIRPAKQKVLQLQVSSNNTTRTEKKNSTFLKVSLTLSEDSLLLFYSSWVFKLFFISLCTLLKW